MFFVLPVVSWLTDVEMHSALAKKVRRRELAEEDAERVQELFRPHVSNALYDVAAIEHGDFVQARQWMARMCLIEGVVSPSIARAPLRPFVSERVAEAPRGG